MGLQLFAWYLEFSQLLYSKVLTKLLYSKVVKPTYVKLIVHHLLVIRHVQLKALLSFIEP